MALDRAEARRGRIFEELVVEVDVALAVVVANDGWSALTEWGLTFLEEGFVEEVECTKLLLERFEVRVFRFSYIP